MKNKLTIFTIAAALFAILHAGNAATINFGASNSTLSLDMAALGAATPINTLDALFDNTTTRADIMAREAPGSPSDPFTYPGIAFTLPNIGMDVNPASLTSPLGRTLQATTLDVDPMNVVGSWDAASSDVGAFISGGEQIGFEGMLRMTGTYTGSLLFGDFALRYSPSRVGVVRSGGTLSGFVLTSNIDFVNAAFADIANASVTLGATSFSITGDILVSDGLNLLAGSGLGTDFGSFSLTAATVPEPTSVGLLLGAALLVIFRKRLFQTL